MEAQASFSLAHLILIAIPAITAGLTYFIVGGIKKLRSIKFSANKKPVLRAFAALLSLGGVIVLSLVTGVDITPDQITEFATLLLNVGLGYLGATGIHDIRDKTS